LRPDFELCAGLHDAGQLAVFAGCEDFRLTSFYSFLLKSVTSAGGFGPTDVFCAKAKRQRQDVGHSVVATGRGVLRLSSTISVGVWIPT